MTRWWRGWVAAIAGLVALSAWPAQASNHLVAIEEVLASWQGDDHVQFIELRMLAPGQNLLTAGGGVDLIVDGADGEGPGQRVFRFPADVTSSIANARILVATNQLANLAGFQPDFVLPDDGVRGVLDPEGGRICYRVNPPQAPGERTGVIDCVAWGRFPGLSGPFGRATRRTPDNRALQRVQLTGNIVVDWDTVLEPTPERNLGQGFVLETFCGDGQLNQGEECDGTNLGGETCASRGFARGELRCDQCHFDVTRCSACGNHTINDDEECDGPDVGGLTCEALGFTGGTLGCTGACRLDTMTCDPTFFVPGGGPPGPECLAEWRIMNGTNRPGGDGRAPSKQRCHDNDVSCDADTSQGSCLFTIALCFDRPDARLTRGGRPCQRKPIESWTVLQPALGDGDDASRLLTAAAALGPATVAGNVVTFAPPLDATERCTEPVTVRVPLRGSRRGVRAVRARTVGTGGRPRDVDTLKLVCLP